MSWLGQGGLGAVWCPHPTVLTLLGSGAQEASQIPSASRNLHSGCGPELCGFSEKPADFGQVAGPLGSCMYGLRCWSLLSLLVGTMGGWWMPLPSVVP